MYFNCKKMRKIILLFSLIIFFIMFFFKCSHNTYQIVLNNKETHEFKKGDIISVSLINKNKINGEFLFYHKDTIVIKNSEDSLNGQKHININLISYIKKLEKKPKPNPVITLGLILVITGFIGYKLIMSSFGKGL